MLRAVMSTVGSWIDQHGWVPGALIGIIFGIPSTVIAFLAYHRSRRRRTVDYRVTSNIRVVSPKASGLQNLEVRHRNKQLLDPRIVRIEIKNTGNEAVRAADYDRPIVVTNQKSAKAIDVFLVRESSPKMVGELPNPSTEDGSLSVCPRLLNKDDSFELQLLYDGAVDVDVSCHFTDQSRPMRQYSEPTSRWYSYDGLMNITVPFVLIVVCYVMWNNGKTIVETLTFFCLGIIIFYVPSLIRYLFGLFDR